MNKMEKMTLGNGKKMIEINSDLKLGIDINSGREVETALITPYGSFVGSVISIIKTFDTALNAFLCSKAEKGYEFCGYWDEVEDGTCEHNYIEVFGLHPQAASPESLRLMKYDYGLTDKKQYQSPIVVVMTYSQTDETITFEIDYLDLKLALGKLIEIFPCCLEKSPSILQKEISYMQNALTLKI